MGNKISLAKSKYRFQLTISKGPNEVSVAFEEYDGPGLGNSKSQSRVFSLQSGSANLSAFKVLKEWHRETLDGSAPHTKGQVSRLISVIDISSYDKMTSTALRVNFTGASIISMRFISGSAAADRLNIEAIDIQFSYHEIEGL